VVSWENFVRYPHIDTDRGGGARGAPRASAEKAKAPAPAGLPLPVSWQTLV